MSFIEGASLRLARTAGALAYLAFIALAFEPAQAQQTPTLSLVVALPEDAITDFALNPQTNKLYLTDVSGKVSVVDPAAKTISTISGLALPGGQARLAINPAQNKVYVASSDGVAGITSGGQVAKTDRVKSSFVTALLVDPLTDQVFHLDASAKRLTQIDGYTMTPLAAQSLADSPQAIVPDFRNHTYYAPVPLPSGLATPVIKITSETTPWNGPNSPASATLSAAPIGTSRYPLFAASSFGAVNSVTRKAYFAIANRGARSLIEYDPTTEGVAFIDVPSPASIGINPVTNRVYAASGSRIAVVDGYSRSVAFVEIGQTLSENIWVDTVHDRVFATGVGFVAILDGATNSVVKVEARNGAGVLEPYQASIVGHPGTGELYLIERLNKALMRLSIPEPANPVVSSIEVAQSVQDLAQSVPLLAGKPTVVRVYVSPGSYGSLTGVLTVTPDNGPAFDISSAATMASTTDALSDRRQDLAKSLNFVIANPPEGRIRVSLKSLSAGWSPWGQSMCTGACSRTVSLQPPLEMRLTVVGVSYQYGSFARKAPRDLDYNLLQSWLKRAYPISTLTFSKLQHDRPADAATSPTPAALFDCKWAADRAAEYRTRDIGRGTDKRTRYYALAFADVSSAPKLPALDVNGSFFAGGCSGKIPTSPDPSVTAAGWTGASTTLIPSVAWDQDGSWGDWNAAHEIGHSLGRRHAGPVSFLNPAGEWAPCTAIDQTGRCTTPPYPCAVTDGADRHYPNPGSQLAADKGGFVGYDLGDTSLGLPMKALSGTQYHDVMSYCDYQWISAYTYMGLLDRLRAESALPPR